MIVTSRPSKRRWTPRCPRTAICAGSGGGARRRRSNRANELLDRFAGQLEARGIRVDRPTPIDHSQPVTTPDFHTASQFGCMPPRDVLLTVGSEILEATMSYRCRWFEYLNYRPLMQKYWGEDPNFRHESAPKPRLTDADYHPDYLSEKIGMKSACNGPPRSSLSPPRKSRFSTRPTCCGWGGTWWCSTGSPRTSRASSGCGGIFRSTACTR